MNAKDLLQSSALNSFHQAVTDHKDLLVEGLWDAPKAALLTLAQDALHQNILILTGGAREERLLDDCSYFGIREVLEFPAWETLPGEDIAPSTDIVGRRLDILYKLTQPHQPNIVFASLQACLQKCLPPKELQSLCRQLNLGDILPFDTLPEYLKILGYKHSAIVSDKGEYALRGGILDIYPISSADPVRIEFFGDNIESLRHFDPISQKSIAKCNHVFLSPASELSLLQNSTELVSILDYLGPSTLIVFDELVELEDRYVALKGLPGANSRYFLSWERLLKEFKTCPRLYFTEQPIEELCEISKPSAPKGRSFYTSKDPLQPISFEIAGSSFDAHLIRHPFSTISDFFSPVENRSSTSSEEILHGISRLNKQALNLHFIISGEPEQKSLQERLTHDCPQLPQNTHFEYGYLSSGFVVGDTLQVVLPMTELTHRYKVRRQKWRNTYHTPAAEFHQLEPGDIVVHFHHGIGKFLGLEKRPNHLGQLTEFLLIEYAQEGMLYVPIQQAYLVSRYIGANEEAPTLHTIGGKQWQRVKAQAEKAIIGYAHDLLHLQAERVLSGGFAFPPDSLELKSFEEEFPYIETEDQLRAIAEIKQDMQQPTAMDRLVCGDVGYGKTEVAMRAAFKAVADGKKQVAVLVPTTILALQHYENFKERMANFPIRIGVVSRFNKPKEIAKTLEDVAAGTIDILIGTHRLISKDVLFHDLGLIIIDEEQRFGVRAKEHLKTLKSGVDCLTLSATPIPRTLYMSLVGARTISVINTPPHDRLPIKSLIVKREPVTIHHALLRELSRDGQAFFIHNRVESIFRVRDELQSLLPQARIVVGHGQMSPDEIDTVFHAFKSGHADILVATTIVENGVDIPNANTILIDHADQFGLADLYQMRGRVGRWNRPAYTYFLTHPHRPLSEISRKRLSALIESSSYGGGMKIAMRDLEIRGAGDILGTQQSGHIATIGFHLYCKLLKRAVSALQKKGVPDFCETKMEFSFDARLPEDYILETSLRMEIYHRFGDARSFEEVDSLVDELKDRFGPCPPQVLWLKSLTRIKIFAATRHITLLKFDRMTLTVEKEKGKTSTRFTVALATPKKPEQLEEAVLNILKQLDHAKKA
ncbi:MAG: transcription-repair coupling factor [Simkania sp.]|nr:transcription-repair coupling factor [Simkania sp.]